MKAGRSTFITIRLLVARRVVDFCFYYNSYCIIFLVVAYFSAKLLQTPRISAILEVHFPKVTTYLPSWTKRISAISGPSLSLRDGSKMVTKQNVYCCSQVLTSASSLLALSSERNCTDEEEGVTERKMCFVFLHNVRLQHLSFQKNLTTRL